MSKTPPSAFRAFLPSAGEMTFVEHLEELRARLLYTFLAVGVSMAGAFFFRARILAFLTAPVGQLRYYSPPEAFLAHIKLAFWGGVFLALPVILNQLWLFFSPALYRNEKAYFSWTLFFAFFFFSISLLFIYQYLPVLIRFCFRFAVPLATPAISYSLYLSFVGKIIFLFGLTFEMPLVFFLLTKIGLLSPAMLKDKHGYALLVILATSALLTPPDIFSMLFLSLPLIILFEISFLFSCLAYRDSPNFAG